jgi:pimeloyl-ACP methyl ester carboxylesterase
LVGALTGFGTRFAVLVDSPTLQEIAMHRFRSLRLAIRIALAMILVVVLAPVGTAPSGAATPAKGGDRRDPKPTVVLVHGAFADASGWTDVIKKLHTHGYPTLAPANPLRGVPSDTAYLRSVLDTVDGPIVLVGHSYGGMVMTNAAVGDRDVTGLVYVAAFAPDEGDTVEGLATKFPGSMLTPDNLTVRPYPTTDPTVAGLEGYINADVFREVFAADVPRRTTEAMAATQRPAELAALQQPSGPPAWASIPSWFVVAKQDNTIPADAQRFMADRAEAVDTIEVRASHVAMISKPSAVTEVILDAARHHN